MILEALERFKTSRFFQQSDFAGDFLHTVERLDRWQWLADRFERFETGASVAASGGIPKIVHQIWIGGKLPSAYAGWIQSWRRLNPGWDCRLWDSKAILREGLKNETAFRGSPNNGVKSDIARYEILEKYGGVYFDTDFECLRPLGELVRRCTFFTGIIFGSSPVISNGVVGASAGHPLIREAVNRIHGPVTSRDGMEILSQTGPGFFSGVLFDNQGILRDTDMVFPSSWFFPVPNFIDKNEVTPQQRSDLIRPWSIAVHYWETSWLRKPAWRKFLGRCKRALLSVTSLARTKPR